MSLDASTMLAAANPAAVEKAPAPIKAVALHLMRGPMAFAALVLLLFFGGFGGWAAVAPLSAGAIAPGAVSPAGTVKAVQHLEGGIISMLHVRDGQSVKQGDLLVTLESVKAETDYDAQREQMSRLEVMRARLVASSGDAAEMVLPEWASGTDSTDLQDFVATQKRLFEVRRSTLSQQEEIFNRQVEQLRSEIGAIDAQNEGLRRQLELINEELVDKESLASQQLVARSTVQALQRQQATLQSDIAANLARVARAEQSIEEIGLSRLQSRDRFQDEAAEELASVNNEIARLAEDLRAAGDVLRRTEIRSPADGVVQNLLTQTPGGVVGPGEKIMDVVPVEDEMVVIARLAPRDIDAVRIGLKAHLTLLPFASRNALPLNGEVTQIAADSTHDERSGQSWYEVKITVSAEELSRHEGVYMSPGMPADVTIVTGERTMLQYLIEPIARSLQTAFVQT